MKLKSLTLTGFKSFADKTVIDFQPGVTGIVGPNGSGKSNITEAIRWGLGEQSAKSLRGGKMADVIFAGTSTRSPLNRAEVVLTFDNSDHLLPHQPETVEVIRRLYRDGTSEFWLNGRQVRLRDIVDLFLDTGLGKESFSIISQGRVEKIFNSKPEERRVIVEELAGVLKYKQEKKRAQQELVGTQEHLDRVVDIITELKAQREPLKEQASIARDYQHQKEQYDYLYQSKLVVELEENKRRRVQLAADVEQASELAAKTGNDRRERQRAVAEVRATLQEKERVLDQLQENVVHLTQQHEHLISEQRVQQQDATFQQERVAAGKKELVRLEAEQAQQTIQVKQLQRVVTQLRQEYETATKRVATLAPAECADDQLAAALKRAQAQVAKLTTARSVANARITDLQTRQSQENEPNAQEVTATHHLEEAQKRLAVMQQDVQQTTQRLKEMTTRQQELTTRLQAAADKERQLRRQGQQADRIYQQATTRMETLRGMAANYNGYYQGVQVVMKAHLDGVIGTVADVLTVPAQYAMAIETVLGGQLQNIVVTNQTVAQQAIKYLRLHRSGRATFLPRQSVTSRQLTPEQQARAAQIDGFQGVAADLVTSAQENVRVVSHLLGATVVASDLAAATRISNTLNRRVRVVTLAGDLISAGGAMTGGAMQHKRRGILAQKQRQDELAVQVKMMQTRLQALNQTIEETHIQVEKQRQQGARLTQDIEHLRATLASKNQAMTTAEGTVARWQQTVAAETKSQQTAAATARRIKELEKELATTTTALHQAEQQVDELTAKQRAKAVARQKQAAEYTAATTTVTAKQAALTAQQDRLADAKQRLMAVTTRIREQQKELAGVKQPISPDTAASLEQKVTAMHERLVAATAQMTAAKEARQQLHVQVTAIERQLTRAQELAADARDEFQRRQTALAACEELMDHHLETLRTKYGVTYEAAAAAKHETDLAVINRQLPLLKRGIDELGTVNLGAIEEFDRVDQRYQFLAHQQADLQAACDQLTATINEMDGEVVTKFKGAFEQLRTAFQQIFPQVFGGGQADLELTAPDNLLETGIEITAQPPGKKQQNMRLLSGGERALTAIALLFATLRVRPVPFVILDEAEAALDDANVARYAQFLRRFDTDTQFIVITHRKGTMMNASVLYGVTMQEAGVSKMVSIAVDDAVNLNRE
ncbi:chromosome segregation protein SMC [Ligilactobacillus sp. LYQ139]|uniref:chromosome segregation protein SMC n=1 Tax=Ligilactobacillus sp. LYQ139 TaxID=3378800 RepID=UPI003853504D